MAIPILDILDTQVETPSVHGVNKKLMVSIVIPKLEPGIAMNMKGGTSSEEVSLPKVSSHDSPFRASLEKLSSEAGSQEKLFPKKSKAIKKQERTSVKVIQYCKLCSRHFNSSQALGGHTSKAHPGESIQYAKKKEIR